MRCAPATTSRSMAVPPAGSPPSARARPPSSATISLFSGESPAGIAAASAPTSADSAGVPMNAAASPARTSVSKAVLRIGFFERRGAVDEKPVRLVRHAAPQFEEPAELHDPRSLCRVLDQLLRLGEQGGGAVPLAGEPGVLRCGGEPPAALTSI